MTRKRCSRTEKAILIDMVNHTTDPVLKNLNKRIYRFEYKLDLLRHLGYNSYQEVYDGCVRVLHEELIEQNRLRNALGPDLMDYRIEYKAG